MSKVKIQGNASGTGVLTVTAPNTSTDRTITLPDSTGTLATTADSVGGATGVDFNDNVKARFGTSDDLEIYHDGSNSIIKDGGYGDLCLRSNDVLLQNEAGTETMLRATPDDRVYLNFNNATKLQTTATGVAVTGGVAIGGTGAANTLDDYEEGTWTPAIGVGSGISIGTTYASNYTKIGNVCTLSASFTLASSSVPASGDVRITGFPFSFKSFPEGGYPIIMYYTYRSTPNLFMHNAGYLYYQTSAVGGNNVTSASTALDAVNFLSLAFSYITT